MGLRSGDYDSRLQITGLIICNMYVSSIHVLSIQVLIIWVGSFFMQRKLHPVQSNALSGYMKFQREVGR